MTTGHTVTSRVRNLLDLVTTIVVLIAAVAFLRNTMLRGSRDAPAQTSISVPREPVPLGGAPMMGSADAKVVLIEFADFQCPFCASFAKDTLPALKADYVDTGKILVAFRHNPLANHSRAEAAAQASECAVRQGKFWELHDRLFKDPRRLEETDLVGYAVDAGLDVEVFRACLSGHPAERVKQDSELARKLGLTGTPVFLVGHVRSEGRVDVSEVLIGARTTTEFAAALDKALRRRGAAD